MRRLFSKVLSAMLSGAIAVAAISSVGFAEEYDLPLLEVGVEVDETNFPDEEFRNYVSEYIDTVSKDGVLSAEEIKNCTQIYLYPGTVKSVKGIEYFTELDSFFCSYNQISTLDLSSNTKLTSLHCDNNQLTSLDVSKNTLLKNVACSSNKISVLNVSGCSSLESLSCNSNQLTTLDISANSKLKDLSCKFNQISVLNVSNNTALTNIECASNKLTSLDLSKNTALTYLDCQSNQLTNLDLSPNTNLTQLHCQSNGLTGLNVSGCSKLASIYCHDNQLTSLDLSKNNQLTGLNCENNLLSSLNISGCTKLDYLTCYENRLTGLNVSGCSALTSIYCQDNLLTGLDVGNLANLETLNCQDNRISSLKVSNNKNLTALYCSNNNLKSLDLSQNTKLEVLSCQLNQLTGLDLSNVVAFGDPDNYEFFLALEFNTYNLAGTSLDEIFPYGFDPNKASNWRGAEYDSKTNSLVNITAEEVNYSYDIGKGVKNDFTLVPTLPAAPEKPVVAATVTNGQIKLSWAAVDGATSYRIYRANSETGAKTLLKAVTAAAYTDTTAAAGNTYYYFVAAYNSKTATLSEYSDAVKVTVPAVLVAPVISTITTDGSSVTLAWNKVTGATSYRIYRADTATGTKTLLKGVAATTYTDSTVTAGKTYYY
ncbi:MAG: hypothetical protein ACI4KM_05345, partial [Oscillospiraceae bacterium]